MSLLEEKAGDWRKNKRRDRRISRRDPSLKVIDAGFFRSLAELANTIRNVVAREGHSRFQNSPISVDIAVMVNQLRITFDLLCFVNADERRDFDPGYRLGYSFVTLPLIRTLIDGFYNITVLLDDPSNARLFRLSGYKRMFDAVAEDESFYGTEDTWIKYLAEQRKHLNMGLEADNFTQFDLSSKAKWTLLSVYLQTSPKDDSEHKHLIRSFTYGPWRQYSEISHLTFRGVHDLFAYLNPEEAPHQQRAFIRDKAELELTLHLGRAAVIIISLLTEIQAVYQFQGHNIDKRLHSIWGSVSQFPEGNDIYTKRYKALMEAKNILDKPSQDVKDT